jgi:hypothetical protein
MASALSFSISRASTVDAPGAQLPGSSSVDFVAAALSLTLGKKMSSALC